MHFNDVIKEAQEALNEAVRIEELGAAHIAEIEAKISSMEGTSNVLDYLATLQADVENTRQLETKKSALLRRAADLCEESLAANPESVEAHYVRALVLRKTGRPQEGLSELRLAAGLAPERRDLQKTLVDSLFEEILTVLDSFHTHHPDDPWALQIYGWVCAATGRGDDAQKALAQALALAERDFGTPRNEEEKALTCKAAEVRKMTDRATDLIVFVSETPHIREEKIALSLKDKGKNVVLLYKNTPLFPLESVFSESIRYENPWQALEIATNLRPIAFHVFSLAADETSILFIRHKPGPVIFDYYDVFPGLIPSFKDQKVIFWQTEALKEADGLCCRDLQYRYAVNVNGWQRNRHTIWFPEYLRNAQPPAHEPEDNIIRAVLMGWIRDPQGTFTVAEEFLRPLVTMGLHIDIVPAPADRNRPPEQLAHQMANVLALGPSVRLRGFIEPERLDEELSQYDVGISCIIDLQNRWAQDYTQEVRAAGISARLQDYLSAGLVLLGSKHDRLRQFIGKRYGTWVDIEDVHNSAGAILLQEAAKRARTFNARRRTFTMEHNIERLLRFYATTSEKVQKISSSIG